MNIRDAIIQQSPSLTLQRAAGDEIARLDADKKKLVAALNELFYRDDRGDCYVTFNENVDINDIIEPVKDML